MKLRTIGTVALVTAAATGLASAAVAAAPARPVVASVTAAKPGDFNGDGYRDLVAGAPNAKVGTVTTAGAVAVSYDSASGVDTTRHAVISQSSAGIPGVVEKGDHFGSSLAVGDFDGDGYSDLAIGAPGEDVDTTKDAGSLTVVFGSAAGLSSRSIAVGYVGGASLTSGDFDKDGRADFATAAFDGPKIWVLRGTTSTTPTPTGISPGDSGRVDSIAAGDVTGDGYADLAVSWWWDDPADQGSTAVFAGSAKGVGKKIGPDIELGDTSSLAIGDVDKDGRGDVIIGGYSGDYSVYPGTANGMDEAHGTRWTEGSSPATSGDVDGDGYADVVSVTLDETTDEALAKVRFGGPDGLTQRVATVKESDAHITPNQNNWFGGAVSATDVNGDGRADVVIGVGGLDDATGAVAVVPATSSGIDPAGTKLIKAAAVGVTAAGAHFGTVLP